MACEIPTDKITPKEIYDILTESKTIAVVGLSPDSSKTSHYVAKHMQEAGYKIYPIYPKGDEILGEKVYRSLSEIEDDIDIVNVFRKSEALGEVVDEVIKKGNVKTIWAQLGVINNDAICRAKEAGFKAVQNRCIKIEYNNLQGE
jgi:hypothetical protein